MRLSRCPFAGLFLCFLLQPVSAGVYRCVDPDGHHHYQQGPCAGPDDGAVELAPLNTLGDALRTGERELLRERRRQAEADRRARQARQRRAGVSAAQRERREERCWKKQQGLEQVNAKLRRGYKPAQGIRLRDRRRVLEDYLRQFCR